MGKTCTHCEHVKDDWKGGQVWCGYYRSWEYIDAAEKCRRFEPIKTSSSTVCYLTTACVEMKNLPDDCHELTTMRAMRDGYMVRNGKEDEIEEYYNTAPKIVEAIDKLDNKRGIYEELYKKYISVCVRLADEGREEEAYIKYKEMVVHLREEYLE